MDMKITLLGNTTTYAVSRFREEAPSLGLEFEAISLGDVVIDVTNNVCSLFDSEGRDLTKSDCYLFRGIGEADQEVMIIARYLLEQGAVIIEERAVDGPLFMDKLFLYTTGKLVPTLDYSMFQSKKALTQVLETVRYPIVMKSTIGSMGRKVSLLHTEEELLTQYDALGPRVILQTYLSVDYDVRAIVVGGKFVDAFKRTRNHDGEFRMNRPGNVKEHIRLGDDVITLCEEVARTQRVEFAGIDLLEHEGEWYVLEVNTSPQFKAFEACTGKNIAKIFLEYARDKTLKKQARE